MEDRSHTLVQGSLVLWIRPDRAEGAEPGTADHPKGAESEAPQACAVVIYTDGLCEPQNPGGIATAAWVAKRRGEVLGTGCRVVAVGKGATGNMAEYCAIIDALQWAADRGLRGLQIRSDSQMCIGQISGFWQVKSPSLQPLCSRAQELVAETAASLMWVPREQNHDADSLSVKAWEAYTGRHLVQRYDKNQRAKRRRRRRRSHLHRSISACATSNGRAGERAWDA
ncbi:MAG: reverse transcriptase-like protein [Ignavibacteriales bacterium]